MPQTEGEHVFPVLHYDLCGPAEALGKGAGQVIPTGPRPKRLPPGFLLSEQRTLRGADHALMGFWIPLQ